MADSSANPSANSAKPYCYEYPHPAVTTDVVLFTLREERLQVLLIERGQAPFKGRWALPGGFLDIDEDLDAGAARELAEETGVTDLPLEQFGLFGTPGRDPRERILSVAYLALAPQERLSSVRAGDDATAAAWFPLEALPALAFDHAEIIAAAQRRLLAILDDAGLAFQFLPETVTLGELHRVYERLLDGAPEHL